MKDDEEEDQYKKRRLYEGTENENQNDANLLSGPIEAEEEEEITQSDFEKTSTILVS